MESWEGTFLGSGIIDSKGCELHNFGDAENVQTRQSVFITDAIFDFQWDDPFFSVSGGAGATRDMDFRIFFENDLLVEVAEDNVGGDPLAIIGLGGTGTIELEFSLCTPDTTPFMKWIGLGRTVTDIQFDTQSSTSFGHANAQFIAGVGAAFFLNTPEFGQDPPQLESYSSRGGTPILFETDGTRKESPEVPHAATICCN